MLLKTAESYIAKCFRISHALRHGIANTTLVLESENTPVKKVRHAIQ
jgi:hypothetical protein